MLTKDLAQHKSGDTKMSLIQNKLLPAVTETIILGTYKIKSGVLFLFHKEHQSNFLSVTIHPGVSFVPLFH